MRNALFLGGWHLFPIWVIQAIHTSFGHRTDTVLFHQFVDLDHIRGADRCLGQVYLHKSVLESHLGEHLGQRARKALPQTDIVRKVEALDERVLEETLDQLVSRELVKFGPAKV